MKNILYILTLLFIMSACASGKKSPAPANSRYQRKPIVEVSEADLKCEAAHLEASAQMLIGKQEEAIDLYRKVLKTNSMYAPSHYELARIFTNMGWLDSALVHAKQAWEIRPENYWYEHLLAKVYEKRQDAKNMISTWEDIVKRNPDTPDRYYDLSNAYLMVNNIPASIEVLDRVEKRFGISEPVSLQKQRLWNALNKPEKARKELEKLADAVPSDPRYNAILAESYMAEKDYAKALQYYNRTLEADPADENIHIALASCHMAMNNMGKAFAHLRAGVMNNDIDCQHKLLFITEFLREKNFFTMYAKRCFLLVDTLVAQCPADGGHAMIYGQMLAAQERYAEAAKQFALHIETDKSQYEPWEALLLCESMVSDTSAELLEHARQATELFPLHTRPYLMLAQGYMKLGDCEKALLYINKCMMVSPSDPLTKQLYQTIKEKCKSSNE